MSAPRIAIVIPAYNNAATLPATLESIQSQQGLGSIAGVHIADDASRDQTIEAARGAWSATVPMKVWPSSQNAGERANVNRVFSALTADHDWALLIHADDLAKPEWLAAMTEQMMRATPATISICSSYDELMPDGSVIPGEDNTARGVELIGGTRDSVKGTLLRGCWWHISGCAIRLKPFDQLGGFREHLPQLGDWEWLLRALSQRHAIEYIPRTLTWYRQHATSVSSQSFRRNLDITEWLTIVREYRDIVSTAEWSRLHASRALTCCRRAARGVISRDGGRVGASLASLGRVLHNWARRH